MTLCVLRASPVALGTVAAIKFVSSRIWTRFLVQSTAPKMRRRMCDHLTPFRPLTRKSQRFGRSSLDAFWLTQ